jgi:tetratricopeptide (TPR) repeat protein
MKPFVISQLHRPRHLQFSRVCRLLGVWGLLGAGASLPFASGAQKQDARSARNAELAEVDREIAEKNFPKAAKDLEGILAVAPNSGPEPYLLLSFVRMNLGDSQGAADICKKGLALYPRSTRLAMGYVALMHRTFSRPAMREKLEEYIKRQPHSAAFQRALGEVILEDNPGDKRASELLAEAVRLMPQDAESHFFYGKALSNEKKYERCIAELNKAQSLAPANEQANQQIYTLIAVANDSLSRSAAARTYFQKALAINEKLGTHDTVSALLYTAFLSEQGDADEAERVLDEILTWDPSSGPAHFERAKLLSRQKKNELAVSEAESALLGTGLDETENRAIHAFLAKTYSALGRKEEAQVHLDWIVAHSQAGATH